MQIHNQLKPTVSIYHDCRRALKAKDGKKLKQPLFPVKVIVYFKEMKFQDPYPTGVSFSVQDFKKAMGNNCPPELRKDRIKVLDLDKRITKEIENIPGYITPELLRLRVTGEVVVKDKIPLTYSAKEIFEALEKQYEADGQVGTGISYGDAKRCFMRFAGPGFLITEVTVGWLERFEKWALSPIHKRNAESETTQALKLSTIGIYLRNLRRVINLSVKNGIFMRDAYPFGEGKYVIRSEETIKFALDSNQKDTVFNKEITDPNERRALALWMFSYYCHGMNFTDMAFLRPERVFPDKLIFIREKTKRTVKNVKLHEVPLRPEAKQILQEYGQHKPYCFGVIDDTMDAKTKNRKIKQWYSWWVNKYMNRITSRLGIPFKVNSYNARHTTAKKLIEAGVHMQHISHILDHNSVQTTEIYTRGMNIQQSKEFTDLL